MGYSIMITTNYATKKFLECEYRIMFGIKCCSECDVSFECDEGYSNGSFIEDWSFEPPPFMKDELFETVGRIFAPVAIDILPC
jgi:hypothetical protein